jgi:hypothetical protein
MKPATAKARRLAVQLQVLIDQGVNGERDAARVKLDRLKTRFDFTAPDPDAEADLFAGAFYRASNASPVHAFEPDQIPWAQNVKWAIETACKIECSFRGRELYAQAKTETCEKLAGITRIITGGFIQLWKTYAQAPGSNAADLQVFLIGLYDGMMNEARKQGERLPARSAPPKLPKAKRKALAFPAGISPHPYTVAVHLGRQIRFSVPLPEITRELEGMITPQLTE